MAAPLRNKLVNFISCVKFVLPLYPCRCLGDNARAYSSNPKELRKFYKNATIVQADGWYEINLDRRKLRTPRGNLFKVPHESLAMAIATEWNSQKDIIKRHGMHLTTLSNTAIDNPTNRTCEDMINVILHFLETDTICYRLTDPEELAQLQKEMWDPILEWAKKRYDISISSTTGLLPPEIPPATREVLDRHFNSYGTWSLHGFMYAVESLKSVFLSLALADKFITVQKAVLLSRLEQEFQTQKWGSVEWYHEVDVYELQARVAAATLFIQWCSESSNVIKKTTEYSMVS